MPEFTDGIPSAYGTGRLPINGPAAQTIATSGTILTQTDVVRVLPTAAVTALILQKPTNTSLPRDVVIVNEAAAGSGFSLTFDVAANSFVANGVTSVIAATNARRFTWDPGTQTWFPNI